jgi:hypothetical protein
MEFLTLENKLFEELMKVQKMVERRNQLLEENPSLAVFKLGNLEIFEKTPEEEKRRKDKKEREKRERDQRVNNPELMQMEKEAKGGSKKAIQKALNRLHADPPLQNTPPSEVSRPGFGQN